MQRGSSYVPLENEPQVEHTIDVLRSLMFTTCTIGSQTDNAKTGLTAPGDLERAIVFAHAM